MLRSAAKRNPPDHAVLTNVDHHRATIFLGLLHAYKRFTKHMLGWAQKHADPSRTRVLIGASADFMLRLGMTMVL